MATNLDKYMDLDNKTKHTVNHEPLHNTQVGPTPAHTDPKEGFVGEDLGVNGRMKHPTTSNNE